MGLFDTAVRSELERRFLVLCREADLPEPETNVAIRVAGKTYEVDCLWRREGVVVELEGPPRTTPLAPSKPTANATPR